MADQSYDDDFDDYNDEEFDNEESATLIPDFKKESKSPTSAHSDDEDDDEERAGKIASPSKKSKKKKGKGSKANFSNQTHAQQEERIQKLRIANSALRHQLKEFTRVLDASLEQNGRAMSANTSKQHHSRAEVNNDNAKQSLRLLLISKEKMFQNAKKKLEIYKNTNAQLKKQLRRATNTERIVKMENDAKQKEKQMHELVLENRRLVTMQRNQARLIEKTEASRDNWPARVSSLQEDLRTAREKLRNLKDKSKNNEDLYMKQHEQYMVLLEKNKELTRELRRYEDGHHHPDKKESKQQQNYKEEHEKLIHKINILEKANKMERNRTAQATKKGKEELKKINSKVEHFEKQIESKEKEMRSQVLQIKKLKRYLRDLALGDLSSAVPWASNMADYANANGDVSALNSHSHLMNDDDAQSLFAPTPKKISVSVTENYAAETEEIAQPTRPVEAEPSAERGPRVAKAASPRALSPKSPKARVEEETVVETAVEEEVKQDEEEPQPEPEPVEKPKPKAGAFAKPMSVKKKKKKLF